MKNFLTLPAILNAYSGANHANGNTLTSEFIIRRDNLPPNYQGDANQKTYDDFILDFGIQFLSTNQDQTNEVNDVMSLKQGKSENYFTQGIIPHHTQTECAKVALKPIFEMTENTIDGSRFEGQVVHTQNLKNFFDQFHRGFQISFSSAIIDSHFQENAQAFFQNIEHSSSPSHQAKVYSNINSIFHRQHECEALINQAGSWETYSDRLLDQAQDQGPESVKLLKNAFENGQEHQVNLDSEKPPTGLSI